VPAALCTLRVELFFSTSVHERNMKSPMSKSGGTRLPGMAEFKKLHAVIRLMRAILMQPLLTNSTARVHQRCAASLGDGGVAGGSDQGFASGAGHRPDGPAVCRRED